MDVLHNIPPGNELNVAVVYGLCTHLSLIDGWIATWHSFRFPVLLLAIAVIATTQFVSYLRRRREKGPLNVNKRSDDYWLLDRWRTVASNEKKGHDQHIIATQEKAASREHLGPKRIQGLKPILQRLNGNANAHGKISKLQVLVFYSSLSGTTEKAALKLAAEVCIPEDQENQTAHYDPLPLVAHDLAYIEYDDYFISAPSHKADTVYFYLVLIPSYNIDTNLNTFLEHLRDTHHDFRLNTASLSGILGFSVFGFGDREGWPTEEEGFCSQAREVDKWLARLTGGKRAFPLGLGDVRGDAEERLREWRLGVQDVLVDIAAGGGLGEGVAGSGDALESDVEDQDDDDGEADDGKNMKSARKRRRKPSKESRLDDVEDLGLTVSKQRDSPHASPTALAVDFTSYNSKSAPKSQATTLEMVPKSSPTYAALTKQGYTIVGSHSGVKICRWTKSALRGRGSCYKFSFYGIKSHLCMETTPSLSCSNKCVFCWRHGTNPVGTVWRWQVDPPEKIFAGVTEGHYQKIKMMKGVPGVRAERFAEAMRIRHCALSLVGEPIFYPHINEFVGLLHAQRISSFLVCNAQHPDQLAALKPVTQLYVSIDASNKESLRKIDRPLHRDFWERFCRCLDILHEKRFTQRTVFRLTLVKGFNIEDEVEGYADLVARGLPCFVEVKGVTYCGTSSSSSAGLTMQNVPFYAEVCAFVVALNDELRRRGLEYGIAAEHAHSCCVLIASTRFQKDGNWHTLIDYERFFECLERGKEFSPEDYMGPPTPDWALWGNGGFDPADERVFRKGKNKVPRDVNNDTPEQS